jgi:hypothetical protein
MVTPGHNQEPANTEAISVKRIAAVAALTITMLAVPAAAALASTGGASTGGSGYGPPGPGQFACQPPPYLLHLYLHHNRHLRRYRNHHPRRNEVCQIPQPPFPQPHFPQNCPAQGIPYGQQRSFTFDVASGSSTVYQTSGPPLTTAEDFSYDGNTYTITSVNPGDSFTMSYGGSLYVNDGPSITDATGYLACSG